MNALFLVLCSILLLAGPAWAGEDGFALYQKGDYAQAAEAFGKKAMEEPDVPRWRYNRGVASARAGDKETAQGALASSLTRDADGEVRFQSAYNLGTLALGEEKYPEAVEMFRKALSEKPGDPDASYNLGLALWRRKKQEEQQQEQQNQQQCQNPQQGQKGEQKDDKGGQGQNQDQNQENKDQQGQDQQNQEQQGQGQQNQDRQQDQEKQQGQGQQQEQGEDQKQDQQQQAQDQKDQGREEEKQAGNTAGAPKPEEQDSEGKLETMPGTQAEKGEEPREQNQGQGMERIRASALLDNVKENPARLLFRSEGSENKRPTSGKDW